VQWAIRPTLEEWAEVATYDPPWIGAEPAEGPPSRQDVIERGLAELEALGWERFILVADGWGMATGVAIATARAESLAGLVLAHAALSHSTEGDRPSINPEVYAAFTQLIRQDAPSFLRHGTVQATGGSVDEELAEKIVERVPPENMILGWEAFTAPDEYADDLLTLDCPMLLVKHEECLLSTPEGYDDAVAALPDAQTLAVTAAPAQSPEFADALRRFCLSL